MEDEIQSVETTAPAQEAETNTAQETEVTTSQSGEDTNAQVETEETQEVDDQSKVKELIEQRSGYKTKWEQQAENLSRNAQALRQEEARGVNVLQEYGLQGTDLELFQLREERKWDKAYSKFPELKEDSDLDTFVYERYAALTNNGENPVITPEEVAQQTIDYLSKREQKVKGKAYEQAEDDISRKTSLSSKGVRRSGTNRDSSPSVSELKQRARQGDDEAMQALMRLI